MGKTKIFWKATKINKLYPKALSGKWIDNNHASEENYRIISAENFILQFNYGIIPFEMWEKKISEYKDPFEGFSESDRQKIKRKMRKLKKAIANRINVSYYKITFSGKHKAFYISKVNDYLREKEKI